MMNIRLLPVIPAVILALAAPADAGVIKENVARLIRKVGIHAGGSYRYPLDRDVTKGWGWGVSIGLSPGDKNGWKYPVSLNFFTQDLHSPNGDQFASVRTRALLGGIGYGWHFGRLSTSVEMQAGYALNHVSVKGDLQQAFEVLSGLGVSVDVKDSWLLRPSIKAEYELTRKFSVRVSGDYVYMRPGITVTTPTQRFDRRWDESNLHANFGVGFYPFRK